MTWLRVGMAVAATATVVAALPVSASALHDAPAAGQPPGYFIAVDASVDNPAGGQGQASASCGTAVVWGGGISNHSDSPFGVSISISSPTGKLGWIGRANNPTGADAVFDVYGLCAKRPAGYKIVKRAVTVAPGTVHDASATCPAGTVVLSGGADSATVDVHSPVLSAAPTSSTTFTGVMANGSVSPVTFQLFVICADQPDGYAIFKQVFTVQPGETTASQPCQQPGTVILGGGVALRKRIPDVFMMASNPDGSTGWKAIVSNTTTRKEGKALLYAICGR